MLTVTENKPRRKAECSTWNKGSGGRTGCSTWNTPGAGDLQKHLESLFPTEEIPVSERQLGLMVALFDELLRWNRRINLTRITDSKSAAVSLFLDSALGAAHLESVSSCLDVGSGAGFPGIVLAILCPDIRFCLLEANRKRVEFLKHAVRTLKLENVTALHGHWPQAEMDERFDCIVSRATFSKLDVWRDGTENLSPEGRLILWRGAGGRDEVPGFKVKEIAVELPGLDKPRKLLLCRPVNEYV